MQLGSNNFPHCAILLLLMPLVGCKAEASLQLSIMVNSVLQESTSMLKRSTDINAADGLQMNEQKALIPRKLLT
ncbi:hypothetical protein AA309_14370 [Microvirga vignae]|uniref:Uncharacterized protein n=1 Tax=Microvirga vignae TaxID=1225564 RepID=A0A0H1RBT8_9HYPH|nr:hypothetical protein AA309_14370 [Microvirga vignae]